MKNPLKQIVKAQKAGKALGIYSCCSANEYVIEAVLRKGKEEDSCVLIESTANQVDQFGGYTGMTPADFKQFVLKKADEVGFDASKLFLGGDHLGPLTFANENETEAMKKSKDLIQAYVKAGFSKIHIDTSMKVADDDPNTRLSDETIARRGAILAQAAEKAFEEYKQAHPNAIEPVYVIGSEVPIPGGQQGTEAASEMEVTKPEDFQATLKAFQNAFLQRGLDQAWNNVIGIVVQPGVEEKDAGCVEYDRKKAEKLCQAIQAYDQIVFEGHSTDYQTKIKLRELVEDGVAILKVGPALTFAMREALFALAFAEEELFGAQGSHWMDVLDQAMLDDSKYWEKHYIGTPEQTRIQRKYSFSDRSRYYMPDARVKAAETVMLAHFKDGVPLNLLSQFMPRQYTAVREGRIKNEPKELILNYIQHTIDEYLYATHQKELF